MPSRLKSLELHGYKTFASRTVFEFAGMVTAIVGPNGSGKSNIADALRWVLGEQSYSLLRGKKTEDMIFSGSEQRARAGMASATVVFDNVDGWLPIDFTEVAIARRAYRDGENEYLLNGQRVRLRDVSELLSQSGLAERTYTIIGQGLVDAALALKAEERRRLFEEAAGIGLHRARREEAIRRLEATRRNLVRVQDILAELHPRLRSLERQAKRAKEYEQVKADLREVLREWYGFHWHREQRYLLEARKEARKQEVALEKAKKAQANQDRALNALRERIQELRARLNDWHRQSADLHNRRESYSRDLAVSEVRLLALEEQDSRILSDEREAMEQVTLLLDRLNAAEEESSRLESELTEAREQLDAAGLALQARQSERKAAEAVLEAARRTLAERSARYSELNARLAERESQVERQQVGLEKLRLGLAASRDVWAEAEICAGSSEAALQIARSSREQAEVRFQTHLEEAAALEAARQEIVAKRGMHEARRASLIAQIDVLDQAERSLAGIASGSRLILQAAREGRLKGIRGAISGNLEVPAALEVAITAVLGDFLDAIILQEGADLDAVLKVLQQGNARGVLLPLGKIVQRGIIERESKAGDVLGVAADLVEVEDWLQPAIDLLLGQVLVVRDRMVARQLLIEIQKDAGDYIEGDLRLVTLDGEVYHIDGPVFAGQGGKDGILSRPRQRKELAAQLLEIENRALDLESEIHQIEEALGIRREEGEQQSKGLQVLRLEEEKSRSAHSQNLMNLEQAVRDLHWQEEQLASLEREIQEGRQQTLQMETEQNELKVSIDQAQAEVGRRIRTLGEMEIDEIQSQVAHWEMRVAMIEQAAATARSRSREWDEALEAVRRQQGEIKTRLDEIEAARQALEAEKTNLRQAEGQIGTQIEALRTQIEPAEKELDRAEVEQVQLQSEEAHSRQALNMAEHHHAQAKIALARRQETLETLHRRLEDDFGLVSFEFDEEVPGQAPLPFEGMVEELPRVVRLSPETEESLKRQRSLLRRMGPVNPEAQAEFREVKERYEFLTSQVDDLNQAEGDVRQVISELDELMQREFQRTFDAVAIEFRQIFTRLFGGGSARLVMTDPEDLTLTGIDIEARLPGRREQGLSLLSGGERSLTAVALVFALLRVSPTPFCILDEVDAMLDEANVGRFRELLRELSNSTQFILITHNRNTVQVADIIYGVTMGRDSASQLVSLKLDEVESVVPD
jgi:chromosome segregation protein